MCAIFVAMLCAGRFGLGWAHDVFVFACHMFMHSYAYVPSILYIVIYLLFGTYLIVSLSFSLSLPLTLVVSWHLNVNPFRPETLFVSGHLLLLLHLTPLPLMSGSMMRRPNRTSWRTFHNAEFIQNAAFIQNAKSFYQISLTLTYPLSSTVRFRSHFMVPQSRALLRSYGSSTPICTDLITLYLSFLLAFRVYVW